ncbi:hypothetical protein F2Q68_00015080 [Brassica cretica]|uniref:Uncharacterized protein n=1 Tax=Brassica cretica TaxID=69181 RepID=A0A8S9HBZ0_BRACR|nr:hypothetical protein F2Q68_00015080 [Brassica cretica]
MGLMRSKRLIYALNSTPRSQIFAKNSNGTRPTILLRHQNRLSRINDILQIYAQGSTAPKPSDRPGLTRNVWSDLFT